VAERYLNGVYLGFNELRRLEDVHDLRDIWEGSGVEEELYVDTRMPRFEVRGAACQLG